MDNTHNTDEFDPHEDAPVQSITLRLFLTLGILACAGGLAYYFISNPKISEKKEDEDVQSVFVETQRVTPSDYPVLINVMGRVMPAQEAVIRAQVSGEILSISENFVPGGFFKKDDIILNIDPTDYELALQSQQAVMKQATAALRLEKGQQSIARDELKILERTTGKKLGNQDLALRKPQMEQALADIASAQAALDIAQINLERTTLHAPFNAIVTHRNTNIGNVVSTNDALATLVGTDEYWIEAEVPTKDIQWLSFSSPVSNSPQSSNAQNASPAILKESGGIGARIGYLQNMTGMIDEKSRLAKVIISVNDPLLQSEGTLNNTQTKSPFVLKINDFVRVSIEGKTLKNAYRLPTQYVRDGGRVWVYTLDGTLDMRDVMIVYEDRDFVYITDGLNANTEIITSDIITPVDGMALKIRGEESAESANQINTPSDTKDSVE